MRTRPTSRSDRSSGPQRSRRGRRYVDVWTLGEDIAAARDVEPQPTPAEDEHEQGRGDSRSALRKTENTRTTRRQRIMASDLLWPRGATTEPVVICVCERCGYGRPANDLETPFSNGIGEPHYNMTFGEGMYAQGAPIPY